MTRRLAVLSLSACALALVAAAPAAAATPELRGVVSGSPYGASQGYIAVPVLYSKMTARRVGLKSPVGLMVIKRNARVKVNGGPSTLPVGLRVGDRFKGRAAVSDLNKRIFYPRITFDRVPQVYFRSKELSLSELTRMIQAVEKNLTALGKFTNDGFVFFAGQIGGLQKQIDDLKALIAGLPKVDLAGLQGQIDALNKQLNDLLASLADYALKSDLAGLLNASGVQALIDAAIAGLDLSGLVDDAVAGVDIPGLVDDAIAGVDIPGLVDDAVAGLDIPTDADIQGLIDTTVAGLDIPTDADIQGLIDTTVAGLDIPTDADIQGLIDTSTAGLASQADLTAVTADLTTLCEAVTDATVTIDPSTLGLGALLPDVVVPVDLGSAVTDVCADPTP